MRKKIELSHSIIRFMIGWFIVILGVVLILYLRGFLDVRPTNLNSLSFESLTTSVIIVLEMMLAYLVTSFISIRGIVLIPACIFVSTLDLYFLQLIFNLSKGKITATLIYIVITLSFVGIIYELSLITIKTIDNLKYQEFSNYIDRWWHSLRLAIKLNWHSLVPLLVLYVFALSFTK